MGRDQRGHAVRRSPTEREGSLLLLELEEIQAERIGASAEQPHTRLMLPLRSGGHPSVNGRVLRVIDPEPGAVGGVEKEFVVAGLGNVEGAAPLDREAVGARDGRIGGLRAKVEVDLAIHAGEGLLVVVESLRIVIGGREPVNSVGARRRIRAVALELLHQVRHGIHILPVGQADQLDARRVIPGAGLARVEGLVDVPGHALRIRSRAAPRLVSRHALLDVTRQSIDRPIAVQTVVILAFDPLAGLAVAAGAVLAIHLLACPRRARRGARRRGGVRPGQDGDEKQQR